MEDTEKRFTEHLTAFHRQQAQHIGDGAYMIDRGHMIEVFASNGMFKSHSVYLEPEAIDILYKTINKEK